MSSPRASGILLHPTSLPGPHGIGDLGPEARRWIDFLEAAGQRLWQVLPLGPTGFGDSPYQGLSSFAGNPLLLSPEALIEDGLLERADLGSRPRFPARRVDFGAVIEWKRTLLSRAHARFASRGGLLRESFDAFCAEQSAWLDDYALFIALKGEAGGRTWTSWPREVAAREPEALERARARLARAIETCAFDQFLFSRQWQALRSRARAAGIRLIGDLPIFVAHDSADVWAHPDLFHLDDAGAPTRLAGVPPDYFSANGQLWGNPLYRWERHRQSGFAWWIARLRATLARVDAVRIDHFRGFQASWEVPAGATTAKTGRWAPGPGAEFFERIREALGGLPLIAEDLGVVTPEVVELRERFRLPGMRVLQFAFGSGPENTFLPHHHERRCVVYTGTHDNDTARGWFASLKGAERRFAVRYLESGPRTIAWDLIRAAFASVADAAVVPLQDVLNLGPAARMNRPGRASGNWTWRFTRAQLGGGVAKKLRELTRLHAR